MKLSEYLHTTDRIPTQLLVEAASSTEIDVLSVLREVLTYHTHRVSKEISDVCLEGVINYYLKCIADNTEANGLVHSRFEAAKELSRLVEHFLQSNPEREKWITMISENVTAIFQAGDRATRNAIETGFLEHCLEIEGARRYFVHWHVDPVLAEAFASALAWGQAHERSESNQREQD